MINFDGYVNSVSAESRQLHGLDSALAMKLSADLDAGDITEEDMKDMVILYQVNYGVDLSFC